MSKFSLGPCSDTVKKSSGAGVYPFNFYSSTYSTGYGRQGFMPGQAMHRGTGYKSNFRPTIYYSARLDDKDNPTLGRILQGNYKTITKRDFVQFRDSDGRGPFPGQVHDMTSGFAKNLPQTMPRSKECVGGFGTSDYKCTFRQKEFRSDSVQVSEKSSKELTGFTREKTYDPISSRPLEAFTWDSQTMYMYPTARSLMKQSFYPSGEMTGREPLPSVSCKANHSNGFTKGNQATADFATSTSKPVGYTNTQQIHPLSMNSIKRENPAEAMNIVNPHNRSTVAQLSYRPPVHTRRVEETRAQQLGAVATAKKEISGYCENELPNLDHMVPEGNPRKFATQYADFFPDPNPSGSAREGHTSGGILPALPNGYTKSTRAATYGPIAAHY